MRAFLSNAVTLLGLVSIAMGVRPPAVDPALPTYELRPVVFPKGAAYVTAEGAIAIVGYNDMRELVEATNALFVAAHPGFRFFLDLPGTRAAPPALARGAAAFAPMGAEFTESQLRAYRQAVGSDPLGIRVAHAAVSPKARSGPLYVVVNRSNPVDRLTADQVARIFSTAGTGDEIARWGQLGLSGSWDGRNIRLDGLAVETPLGEFMLHQKMRGRRFAPGFEPALQSEDVVRRVAGDPAAIGFARANVVTSAVKVVAVAETAAGPYSRGSAEDVAAGRYPYDRYLYIYVRPGPDGRIDPFVKEYLRLVLSRQGQQAVADTPQAYLPLNRAEIGVERAKLGI